MDSLAGLNSERGERRLALIQGFAVVAALHGLVALYYKNVVGIDIAANPRNRPWDWFWQTVPADLLVNDLLGSIWHLHSQPPLFNLYGAFFFNFFPSNPLESMQFANIILGSLTAGMVYLVLAIMLGRKWLALAAGLFLALNPDLFLFEGYILYDMVTAFLIVSTVCLLMVYAHAHKIRYAILFITALNMLVLTRSVYHLLIIPIGITLAAFVEPRQSLRVVLIGVVISFLALGWYTKNQFLYGFFGASSWQGFALWEVASHGYSENELQALSHEDVIHPMLAELAIFQSPDEYARYGFDRESQVEILSRQDPHNINIIDVARTYQDGAIALIRRRPVAYVASAANAYSLYSMPAAQLTHLSVNAAKMRLHIQIADRLFRAGFLLDRLTPGAYSISFFLLPAACLAAGLWILLSLLRAGIEWKAAISRDSVLLWILFLVIYTTAVSVLFEIGENSRERFYVAQLVPVLLLVTASYLIDALRARTAGIE